MTDWLNRTHVGDCRDLLPRMAADGLRVQTCVTSPPYWGLRDYGVSGQIGLERTPAEYITQLVEVFRLVRRLLADDGTLWLVLGDSFASSGVPGRSNLAALSKRFRGGGKKRDSLEAPRRVLGDGFKPKDLIGIPWRLALALQADGWYLRSDVIEEVELYCPCGCGYMLEERIWRWSQDRESVWVKPNAQPESVTDRPTRSHEYVFLLSKSDRYYYDAAAIREPVRSGTSDVRKTIEGLPRIGGKHKMLVDPLSSASSATNLGRKRSGGDGHWRNKRSVWTVGTTPFAGAHYAVFPRKLIEPCILAGARPGDVVLDAFAGSGTTRQAATDLGRQYVGCELNVEYVRLEQLRRTSLGMPV